jgi:hypothetical protein
MHPERRRKKNARHREVIEQLISKKVQNLRKVNGRLEFELDGQRYSMQHGENAKGRSTSRFERIER